MINICQIDRWDQEEGGMVLIRKLQEFGVIPKEGEYKCPRGHIMVLRKDGSCFKWRCNAKISVPKKKSTICNYGISIRKGTFFEGSHLSISQICKFVNLWVDNVELRVIKKQVEISSESTSTDWSSFCREVCYDYMVLNKEKIGGEGKIVEIDETKVGKRKYNRGKRVEGQWVFGGIERDSGKIFLVPVELRDRATLLPIIKEWILPGSTIMSDCWKPYDILGKEGYEHLTVNHSVTFKDPETGACTNKIESSWGALKRSISSSGRRKYFFPGYLAKYMFIKRCRILKLDFFVEFLKAAGTLYNPLAPRTVESELQNAVSSDEEVDEDNGEEDEFGLF